MSNYKGFNHDFTCRGVKYEVGVVYTCNENVKACEKGFHACEEPFAVLNYYPFVNEKCELNRYAEVNQSGVCDKNEEKIASQKIKIKAELDIAGLVKAQVKYVQSKIKTKTSNLNTGNYSAATNTGHYSAATNTGNYSAATNTGYRSAATNTGNYSAATNTGNYSAAQVTGSNSVALACGYKAKAAASEKGFIIICDWRESNDGNNYIKKIYTAKVGGKIKGVKIEPDTFYWFDDGELKQEKKED